MDIKEYFKKLGNKPEYPRTRFINQIMIACHVKNKSTVYRWLNGSVQPGKLQQEKISEITGIPVKVLFPNQKEVNHETK